MQDYSQWDGKTPITVRLQGPAVDPATADDQLTKIIYRVALHYPQYTIAQLYNEVPYNQVVHMYATINSEFAERMLTLNTVINGPNAKNKSIYGKTIKQLSKIAHGE